MAAIESSSDPGSHGGSWVAAGVAVDRAVVWLHGEHDISTVAEVSAVLGRAISNDDADVVVDLSEVRFIGAATVGVLVRTHDLLRQQSRRLVLRSPSRCAQRVLDVCDIAYLARAIDVSEAQ